MSTSCFICSVILVLCCLSAATTEAQLFNPSLEYAAGNYPCSIAIGDLDGDSFPDLATAISDDDNVAVLFGNGDGTFQPAVSSRDRKLSICCCPR